MQSHLLDNNTLRKSLEITISSSEVNAEYEKVINDINLKTKVPGFRPGKASKESILSRYSQKIKLEIAESLIKKHFTNATTKANLQPISNPILKEVDLEINKNGKIIILFDVKPNIVIPEYKNLNIVKKKKKIKDTHILEQIELIRQKHAKLIPSTNISVQNGNIVKIDIKEKQQGSKHNLYNNQIIQITNDNNFNKKIIDMQPNETKKFSIEIPTSTDHQINKINYEVTLKEIYEQELPEINDDLAKSVGTYNTLDDLKIAIRNNLENVAEQDATTKVHNFILETLTNNVSFDIPDSMVNLQLDDYCHEFSKLANEQGISPKKINWTAYRQNRLKDARRAVTAGYILQAIGQSEDIIVSDDTIDTEIKTIMNYNSIGKNFTDFKQQLIENGYINEIKGKLRTQAILQRITTLSNVTEEYLDDESLNEINNNELNVLNTNIDNTKTQIKEQITNAHSNENDTVS